MWCSISNGSLPQGPVAAAPSPAASKAQPPAAAAIPSASACNWFIGQPLPNGISAKSSVKDLKAALKARCKMVLPHSARPHNSPSHLPAR